MDIQTYEEATKYYNRYKLCKELTELSDTNAFKEPKYINTLCEFVREFRVEFMMFVQHRMEESGIVFQSIHCNPVETEPEP